MRDEILFDESSSSLESAPFYVRTGWFGLLTAFGFQGRKVAVAPGKPKVRPMACVRMIRADYDIDRREAPCGVIRDIPEPFLVSEREGGVATRGRTWSLSACDTVALIDIPGVYRLVLNDPASLGMVAIYLSAMLAHQMGRPSALYFGE